MDEATLRAATQELKSTTVTDENLDVVSILMASGLSETKSAARRTVSEGGAYINNVKYSDLAAVVSKNDLLHGRYLLVRRGKKNLAVVEVA